MDKLKAIARKAELFVMLHPYASLTAAFIAGAIVF